MSALVSTIEEIRMKRWNRLAAVATISAAMGLPQAARAAVSFDVEVAPPPPRYEVVPPPRVGYVWTPGYWRWDAPHHRHVWVRGRYIHGHRGEHWVAHRWHEHDGRYRFENGHWERG
jgi:hypothetical protein